MKEIPASFTLLLLLGLISASHEADARSWREHAMFQHLSTSNGLSQSTVNCILQDSHGFMWFGTQDGLNRYDGYTFTVYRHNPADSGSISDNYIWCLLEARDGTIWAGTLNNGLSCYSYATDRFERYVHNPADTSSLRSNDVTALWEDSNGELWVGTWGGGLDRLDRKSGKFVHWPIGDGPGALRSPFVRCLTATGDGTIWVGTWDGLASLDRSSGKFTSYPSNPLAPGGLSGDNITFIFEDAEKRLWVGTADGGLNRLGKQPGRFLHYRHRASDPSSMSSNDVLSVAEDRAGRVWVTTSNAGVSRYDPASDRFVTFRHDPFDPASLSSDRVYSAFADRTGALWFGTGDGGVNRFDPSGEKFTLVQTNPADPAALSDNTVRAILQDSRGGLWVGTAAGGLNWHRKERPGFIHFRHDRHDRNSIGSDAVMTLLEDRRGKIWVGTEDAGLDRFDRATGAFVHYRPNRFGRRTISGMSVMSLCQDGEGTIWAGMTGAGLDRYDPRADAFIPVALTSDSTARRAASNVWALHEDRLGHLWIGTWGAGLLRYDEKTGKVTRYQHDPLDSTSLANNTVWAIYEGAGGILWLGTWGGGLSRFDPASGIFTSFTERDGLPNNVVYGILPDNRGNLWLSTNAGLARFNPRTRRIKVFDQADGLQGEEFNQGAYWKGQDGTLYFGGISGLNTFVPDSLSTTSPAPPVVLTSFKIFDKPAPLGRSITTARSVSVSYHQDFLAFEFAALDFRAPAKNRYAYKLDGFDRDWIECGTRHYAAYTGLSPGTYTFRVKGANSDGVWNEAGASLRITIRPPFWETSGFIAAAGAVVLLAGFTLYRYRVRKLVEIERLRTRIASDLHDELASNLSSIATFSSIIHGSSLQAGNLHPDHLQLLERIMALSQESVASIRDIIWAIDPKQETVYDLLVRLRDLAIPACRAHGIRLVFPDPVRGELPSQNLSPEQRKHFWLLLKETVTNAMKHSSCRELSVGYSYAGGRLRVNVRDDGAGFSPDPRGSGKGLANMRMRAGLLGGTLDIRSDQGRGTEVLLEIGL